MSILGDVYAYEQDDIDQAVPAAGDTVMILENHESMEDWVVLGGFLALDVGVARNFQVNKRTKDRRDIPIGDANTTSKDQQMFLVLKPFEGISVTVVAGADGARLRGVFSYIRRERK